MKTNSDHGLETYCLIIKYYEGDAFETKAIGQTSFQVLSKIGEVSRGNAEQMVRSWILALPPALENPVRHLWKTSQPCHPPNSPHHPFTHQFKLLSPHKYLLITR